MLVKSVFDLPEFISAEAGRADLQFLHGAVRLPSSTMSVNCFRQGIQAQLGGTGDDIFLHWEGVASFRAVHGEQLICQSHTDHPALLRLFLESEALGLLLFQKEFFLLHASAVRIHNQAVVFMGMPGAGKSTLAAACIRKGHCILSDDLVAIRFDEQQRPLVLPAFPQIKIWEPTAQGLEFNSEELTPLFEGSKKYVFRQPGDFPQHPVPLKHIVVLSKHGLPSGFTEKTGPEAFLDLTRYFALPGQLLHNEKLALHFEQASQIVQQVPIWHLARPDGFNNLLHFVEELTTLFNWKSHGFKS